MGATIGAVVGRLSDLSMLAGVAMGLGVAGVKAVLDQHNKLRELQGNQLYAARSQYVEKEWRHALLEQDHKSARYIRPVYWAARMYPSLKELRHIHFKFDPELQERVV